VARVSPHRGFVKVDIGASWLTLDGAGSLHAMKIDLDLKAGFLQSLKREVLATLTPEERVIIEVSTDEMGNKPDAVKLGWLKMRTKESWTKQRYTKALAAVMTKLRDELAAQSDTVKSDKANSDKK
jgi:hypothetical protein